jgi:peptidoglycan/LPS O-acetylase OafA/YrhL
VRALDGLRGVAIVLVVAFHSRVVLYRAGFVDGGYLGVDLFFVLSGFLITALLLREEADRGRVSFGNFYVRRALRLLPALFFFLAMHALYVVVTQPTALEGRGDEAGTILAAVLYGSNWLITFDPTSVARGLGHLWSLAIEEQFYLLWPGIVIAFLGLRRRVNVVVAIVGTAIVVVTVYRAALWLQGKDWTEIYYRTDARADALLIGALLAILWVRGLTPRRGLSVAAWMATAVMLVCVQLAQGSWLYLGGFTVFALAAAAMILVAVDGSWVGNRVLEWGPLRLLGRVSYGLYLWQSFVFYVVARYGDSWGAPTRLVVAYVAIACATAVSWFVVERPALRLKARLAEQADPTPAAAGAQAAAD